MVNRESITRGLIVCAALAALAGQSDPALAGEAAPAAAQAAAKPPAKPAAAPLGRMFFTPAQRASLDVARTQRARTTVATEQTDEVTATPAAPVPQTVTFDGMVRRSDGKSTVWLNNRAVNENEQAVGAVLVGRVRPDGGISLEMPQSGRSVELKVGQSIELLSGAIEESYARKPPPAAAPEAKPAAEAKGAKPGAPGGTAAAGRTPEERAEQRVGEAARALQQAAGAKPAPASGAPEGPAR